MFKPQSPLKGCDHVTECVDRPRDVVIVVVAVVVVFSLFFEDFSGSFGDRSDIVRDC